MTKGPEGFVLQNDYGPDLYVGAVPSDSTSPSQLAFQQEGVAFNATGIAMSVRDLNSVSTMTDLPSHITFCLPAST